MVKGVRGAPWVQERVGGCYYMITLGGVHSAMAVYRAYAMEPGNINAIVAV